MENQTLWIKWILDFKAWGDSALRCMVVIGILATWIFVQVKVMGNEVALAVGPESSSYSRKK